MKVLSRWVSISSLLGIIVVSYVLMSSLSSCGKVTQTQDADEKKERTYYDVHYSVPMVSEFDLAAQLKKDPKTPTVNVMLFDGLPIYSVVFGIKNNENLYQMAWGQAMPSSKEVAVSDNVILEWDSKATNKNNVTLNKAVLKEVYIDLKNANYKFI